MDEPKFKVGDNFKFDIESMKENNRSVEDKDDITIHIVTSVDFIDGLGYIIGYDRKAHPPQTHEDWLIKV